MQRRNAARHAPMMYVKTARPEPLVCVKLGRRYWRYRAGKHRLPVGPA